MGKYNNSYAPQDSQQKKHETHPIWRGVGFGLAILTPILGYFGAVILLQSSQIRAMIPQGLLIRFSDPYILARILLAIVLAFLIFFIFQFVTVIVFRVFAPPRYGPYDVPPVRYRGKKRSR